MYKKIISFVLSVVLLMSVNITVGLAASDRGFELAKDTNATFSVNTKDTSNVFLDTNGSTVNDDNNMPNSVIKFVSFNDAFQGSQAGSYIKINPANIPSGKKMWLRLEVEVEKFSGMLWYTGAKYYPINLHDNEKNVIECVVSGTSTTDWDFEKINCFGGAVLNSNGIGNAGGNVHFFNTQSTDASSWSFSYGFITETTGGAVSLKNKTNATSDIPASVEVAVPAGAEASSASMITAAYSADNELLGMNVYSLPLDSNKDGLYYKYWLNAPSVDGASSYKTFLWDSLDGLKPITVQ